MTKRKTGLEILGISVCDPSFVAASLWKRVNKLEKTVRQPCLSRQPSVRMDFFEAVLMPQSSYVACIVTFRDFILEYVRYRYN